MSTQKPSTEQEAKAVRAQTTKLVRARILKRSTQGGSKGSIKAMGEMSIDQHGVAARDVRAHSGSMFKGSPMDFINKGPTEAIRQIREGLPYGAVVTLADELRMTRERFIETIGLPKSTLKSRQTSHKALSAAEGDRLARVGNVLKRAVEVLEDDESARKWVKRENRAMGGAVPLSLLDTEAGYELVLDTLGRIEHGVVA